MLKRKTRAELGSNPNNWTVKNVRQLSIDDLHASVGIDREPWIASVVAAELRHRENHTARWALRIAFLSMAIAGGGLLHDVTGGADEPPAVISSAAPTATVP